MKKLSVVILLICTIISTVFAGDPPCRNIKNGTQGKKYDLKYKMNQGAKFTLTYTDAFERTTYFFDGDITGNTIDDTFEGSVKVKSVEKDKELTLEMEILKASRLKKNPGGTFPIEFKGLIGEKVIVALSPYGIPLWMGVLDELPDRDRFLRRTGPDQYLHRIFSIFPKLPEDPVSIGDTWTHKIEAERPAYGETKSDIISNYMYKLLEEAKINGIDCLKIECTYTQSLKSEGEMRGHHFKTEFQGKGTETIYFAHKKGMVLQKEGTFKHEGTRENGETLEQEDAVKYSVKVKFAN